MKIHIVQHVSFETPGFLLDWAKEHHHQVTIIRPDQGDLLPSSEQTDFMVVLGGPMSVHDEKQYPWLVQEKKTLKKFIDEQKKPLLGICLGAQLIADALGGKVSNNSQREIGWLDVNLTSQGKSGVFSSWPKSHLMTFHWHSEIFNLPPHATLLAHSEATPVQAFQYGSRVLALQFHPEMNASALEGLMKECSRYIDPSKPFEQNAEEINQKSPAHFQENRQILDLLLKNFLDI